LTTEREIDQQLVERVQRGDKKAFELLVVKYQRKLMRLVSRLVRDQAEAEDVVQEAFIKAYRALPQFRGDSAFYTWLYPSASTLPRTIWSPWGAGRQLRQKQMQKKLKLLTMQTI
jgi:RNA polymerase sigma factor (sigma-70 family)